MSRLSCPLLLLTIAASFAASSRVAAQSLTTIDYPGAFSTSARSVNARGQIVGWYLKQTQLPYATGFLWDRGETTSIQVPNARATTPSGINNRGQIVGTYEVPVQSGSDPRNYHGFLLEGSQFTDIVPPGAIGTMVNGINNRGDIVGEYYTSGPHGGVGAHHGFVLQHQAYTEIAVPNAIMTQPTGIDDGGRVIGVYVAPQAGGGVHAAAFLWHDGVYDEFELPPGGTPYTFGPHGEILGTTGIGLVGDTHAFRYEDGSITTFDVAPGPGRTILFGANQRGDYVGAFVGAADGRGHGFLLGR